MSADGPVDLVRQGERQKEIATTLFHDLARVPWTLSNAFFTQAGHCAVGVLTYVDDHDAVQERPLPGAVLTALLRLREEMWNPETLPWYHTQIILSSAGEFRFFFNYERRFDVNRRPLDRVAVTDDPQPTDADLLEDLRLFPRSPDHIPAWYPTA